MQRSPGPLRNRAGLLVLGEGGEQRGTAPLLLPPSINRPLLSGRSRLAWATLAQLLPTPLPPLLSWKVSRITFSRTLAWSLPCGIYFGTILRLPFLALAPFFRASEVLLLLSGHHFVCVPRLLFPPSGHLGNTGLGLPQQAWKNKALHHQRKVLLQDTSLLN